MRAGLLLLVLLAGCAELRVPVPAVFLLGRDAAPERPVRQVTCGDVTALAAAIVDGRRRGQSRFEQRLFVAQGRMTTAIHSGLVESVYDWPRPVTARDWSRLTEATVTAASAHCLNRPGAAIEGVVIG